MVENMRVADFFCGGGGFSEGFRQAGFQIVFAVDKWEPAISTYKGNKPGVNVIQDDVIRISKLDDEEFERLVPDSEVIIGSPPCQAFSQSNRSGNADKTQGIELIKAYLRIIARKKSKPNAVLRYWVLENVPNVKKYIEDEYTAKDLGLEGDFILRPHGGSSGIYNAKYFGAPTNRKRYLCGEFPALQETHADNTVVRLSSVLGSLGEPLSDSSSPIVDVNYPGLCLSREEITDHQYIYELAPFEWTVAKRLKQDKGYMGQMSFPENQDRPARTVMATMSVSSREAMILGFGDNRYRLPTVREAASMMSFPMDYRFYGKSKATKHTLVGNSVPPKMSYAIAKAIVLDAKQTLPVEYIPIQHDPEIDFTNLNGMIFPLKTEKPKRDIAKFKYHIPYLILSAYRVELTNYKSDFEKKQFKWDVELHFSQGKDKAAIFNPVITENCLSKDYKKKIIRYLKNKTRNIVSYNRFQELFCMTSKNRSNANQNGPYELLEDIKQFIDSTIPAEKQQTMQQTGSTPERLPQATIVGYYILSQIIKEMGEFK